MMKMDEKRREIMKVLTKMDKALCIDFCNLASRITKICPEFENNPDFFFNEAWDLTEESKAENEDGSYEND